LKQTAQEFEALHWVRLALCLPASVFSQVGLLKYHRRQVEHAPQAP
jgi:hypothetical protein